MNPTLFAWIDSYNVARASHDEEVRAYNLISDPVTMPPATPREMQFTITSTGLLRDVDGRRLGHVTELHPGALRNLGVIPERLTARQRRTPATRAQRREAALITAVDELETELAAMDAATHPPHVQDEIDAAARRNRAAEDADRVAQLVVALNTPATWGEDFIPYDAAPGDIVTNAQGERVGTVGINGRNERIIIRDPNPMRDRLRRPLTEAFLPGTPAVTGLDVEQERTIMSNLNAAIASQPIDLSRLHLPNLSEAVNAASANVAASMGTSMAQAREAMESILNSTTTAAPAPEVYEGPRLLATLNREDANGERFREHTATAQAARDRAGWTYHGDGRFSVMARRARGEDPTPAMIDRGMAAVDRFLIRGFGLELEEGALAAVTAMTTVMIRQAARPEIQRADALQTNVNALDAEVTSLRARLAAAEEAARDRDADEQHAGRIVDGVLTPPAPGTAEAAAAAAKAWEETGVEDSVAKLASFRHLLDTLKALAR